MPTKLIGSVEYDALLEAFREQPGVVRAAARKAGVRPETAHRAWHRGWPDRKLRPIKELVEQEMLARRALRAEERDAAAAAEERDAKASEARRAQEVERARLDAAASRKEEALLVRTTRRNLMALAGATAQLTDGSLKLAQSLRTRLLEMAATGQVDVREGVSLIRAIAAATKHGAEAARLVLQMERLLLGEPTEILGLRGAGDLSLEEHLERIDKAARAGERFKKRLRLIEGGRAEGRGDRSEPDSDADAG